MRAFSEIFAYCAQAAASIWPMSSCSESFRWTRAAMSISGHLNRRALPKTELYQLSAQIGFAEGKIVERFDCYECTSAKAKLSKDLYVQGVNFSARKPVEYLRSAARPPD